MATGRIVIIGVGHIGLHLIKSLSRDYVLVCIDVNETPLKTASDLQGENLSVVVGDATSRLVLEEAGVEEADTVVITTTVEKVSLEVARVLKDHFQVKRVLAVGITQKGISALEELGAEVENIFTVSATGLRNRLEYKTKAVHGIGLGKNEILEVEVHPNSRLANKSLASIAAANWLVGLIYREGRILIPRGETRLKARDRVVILGQPQVLKTVSEILTFRFEKFPLEYGNLLITWLTGKEERIFFDELAYLFSVFPLEGAILVHSPEAGDVGKWKDYLSEMGVSGITPKVAASSPLDTIREVLAENAGLCGMVALSGACLLEGWIRLLFHGRSKRFLSRLSKAAACPILLANGTFPYEKAAVPCLSGFDLQSVLETIFEISSSLNCRGEALFVNLSKYISSGEELGRVERMKKVVADLSTAYKSTIRERTLKGNPIREVLQALPEFNLLVADAGGWRPPRPLSSLLNPDVPWEVVRKAGISTMLVPSAEESL
jgi:Trk K+ transport system NAD-binding subunit